MQAGMAKGSGNNLAVVFFAGHGAILGDELFLLPYNVAPRSPARVKASALSVSDLRRELAGLAAQGRVLVLLNACPSGALTGDGVSLGTNGTALRTGLEAANITVLTHPADARSRARIPPGVTAPSPRCCWMRSMTRRRTSIMAASSMPTA